MQPDVTIMDIPKLAEKLRQFAQDRDWEQFHSPKNLVMALGVEAAELQEIFQWLTEEQSGSLDDSKLSAAAAEIADIQIYLVRIADSLGVDIELAVKEKLTENDKKYPADKVRGSAAKYTSYEEKE